MQRPVLLTAGAERDLRSIYEHIAEAKSERAAEQVLDRLLQLAEGLRELPERGKHPPELLALGIREFRQLTMKRYRIIYRSLDSAVVILLVADGRRDMQTLLAQRLLGA